jgi:FkbM family methyltransferase
MFHSQEKQDKYLETNIFKGLKNGFFVDVGAYDGKHINNTLYFEETNQWNGINVEPNKKIYDALVINRPKNINLNCAVFNEDGETEFLLNTGYTEMLSGIKNTFDSRHVTRLEKENKSHGSTTETVTIATKRLETIFDEHKVTHVHYLSIDVEGAEFEVIQSINFDKVFIDVIAFENNYNDQSVPIIKYLEDHGYVVIHRSIDIFMIHKKSTFHVLEQEPSA